MKDPLKLSRKYWETVLCRVINICSIPEDIKGKTGAEILKRLSEGEARIFVEYTVGRPETLLPETKAKLLDEAEKDISKRFDIAWKNSQKLSWPLWLKLAVIAWPETSGWGSGPVHRWGTIGMALWRRRGTAALALTCRLGQV